MITKRFIIREFHGRIQGLIAEAVGLLAKQGKSGIDMNWVSIQKYLLFERMNELYYALSQAGLHPAFQKFDDWSVFDSLRKTLEAWINESEIYEALINRNDEAAIRQAAVDLKINTGPGPAGIDEVDFSSRQQAYVTLGLVSVEKKIQLIKEVRALTGYGLKEAKDIVEGCQAYDRPSVVCRGDLNTAAIVTTRLKNAGAEAVHTVVLDSPTSDRDDPAYLKLVDLRPVKENLYL